MLVTAQRGILDQVLHLFAIEPDHDLDLMRGTGFIQYYYRGIEWGKGSVGKGEA